MNKFDAHATAAVLVALALTILPSCDHYSVYRELPHGYILSSLDGSGCGLTIWAPQGGEAVVPKYWEEDAVIEISSLARDGDVILGEVWNRKTDQRYEYFVLNTADGKLFESKSETEWKAALGKQGIERPPPLVKVPGS